MDWQPLETHDGSSDDVLVAEDGQVFSAWYDGDRGEWWQTNNDASDYWGSQLLPTHWMPYPPAPITGASPRP